MERIDTHFKLEHQILQRIGYIYSCRGKRILFRNLQTNHVTYTYTPQESECMELAFKKTLSDARKTWISQGTKTKPIMDNSTSTVSTFDFIHKDLIWFSIADNMRSIPHMMDGLKPSQRKVLYACRKRSNKEIKVSQLAGYVSTETCYHHGEQSMMATIIGMAQDYLGSNNINFLVPKGQFGTRLMGGKDAASPRYIFTQLNDKVDQLFPRLDDPLLTYTEDDGTLVEPEYFVPTLPTVLVNGCDGIGTGYSTSIPCYNPKDIVHNIKRVLNNKEQVDMIPWYSNFQGSIVEIDKHKYETRGVVNKISEKRVAHYRVAYREMDIRLQRIFGNTD